MSRSENVLAKQIVQPSSLESIVNFIIFKSIFDVMVNSPSKNLCKLFFSKNCFQNDYKHWIKVTFKIYSAVQKFGSAHKIYILEKNVRFSI